RGRCGALQVRFDSACPSDRDYQYCKMAKRKLGDLGIAKGKCKGGPVGACAKRLVKIRNSCVGDVAGDSTSALRLVTTFRNPKSVGATGTIPVEETTTVGFCDATTCQ